MVAGDDIYCPVYCVRCASGLWDKDREDMRIYAVHRCERELRIVSENTYPRG